MNAILRIVISPYLCEKNHPILMYMTAYFQPNAGHITNKNLAIANRSRVSCAHNTPRASIGINITL